VDAESGTPESAQIFQGHAALWRVAERAAASPFPILLTGETGVGKEVMAAFIHRSSSRSGGPFVSLNCAALSTELLESELFGHERGSFTGAIRTTQGLIASASGGTVFLDEIGDMALGMQSKLLRVLETREVRAVGGLTQRKIDVRFLAATNKDLATEVHEGRFRSDLFYRISTIAIRIPALRDRPTEIGPLARGFLAKAAETCGRTVVPSLSEAAMKRLMSHDWPGNVRELRNVIERALVFSDGSMIEAEHLAFDPPIGGGSTGEPRTMTPEPLAREELKAAERRRMVDALDACGWNQSRAALLLGIPRRTFISKLDRYGIPRPQKYARLPAPARGKESLGLVS
jgi:DNA-binding NtrC family response regulator